MYNGVRAICTRESNEIIPGWNQVDCRHGLALPKALLLLVVAREWMANIVIQIGCDLMVTMHLR